MNMLKVLIFGFIFTLSIPAFAQGGDHVGGGDPIESDFQEIINKIMDFMYTKNGIRYFPEVIKYDQEKPNQLTFKQLVEKIHPRLTHDEVKDGFGIARTCVSHFEKEEERYFICQIEKLPEFKKLYFPSYYRIILHELFVQAGIEQPISESIPSVYNISTKITTFMKYIVYADWELSDEIISESYSKTGCKALYEKRLKYEKQLKIAQSAAATGISLLALGTFPIPAATVITAAQINLLIRNKIHSYKKVIQLIEQAKQYQLYGIIGNELYRFHNEVNRMHLEISLNHNKSLIRKLIKIKSKEKYSFLDVSRAISDGDKNSKNGQSFCIANFNDLGRLPYRSQLADLMFQLGFFE